MSADYDQIAGGSLLNIAIKAKTDLIPASPAAVGSAMTLTAAYDDAKTAAQAGDAMTLTAAYDPAKTPAKSTQLDFWGARQANATIGDAAGDVALPSVALPNIAGLGTIAAVYAMVKYDKRINTNAGVNKLSGAQDIQVKESAAGTFTDAIALVDDDMHTAAASEGPGDVLIGAVDIKTEVAAFNKTYNFQIDEAVADAANLVLYGIQCGLRVILTV